MARAEIEAGRAPLLPPDPRGSSSASPRVESGVETKDEKQPFRPHIFIAEDNDADVLIIREILEQQGLKFNLTVARDGQQAFRIIENIDREPRLSVFDIALIDINLPRHTGHEVLACLRQSVRLRHTPALIVSSSESQKDVAQARQLGATAYFRKPAELDEYMKLGPLVELLLRKHSSEP